MERIYEWKDDRTDAEGWVVLDRVINQVAGGGIFMHPGATVDEVADVARNMSYKFTVTDPQIGGAKAGIRFDHTDPRRDDVLRRFILAHAHLLRQTWVTGGDLNTSDVVIENVINDPKHGLGLPTSQWALATRIAGIPGGKNRSAQLAALRTRPGNRYASLVDAAVGYGVAEAIAFTSQPSSELPRVIIQGAGTVGSGLAYYLTRRGLASVVAIADGEGWLTSTSGLPIKELLEIRHRTVDAGGESPKLLTPHISEVEAQRLGVTRVVRRMRTQEDLIEFLSAAGAAEVFSPCAGRYQVTAEVAEGLLAGPWRTTSCRILSAGANNPFGRNDCGGMMREDREGEVATRLREGGVIIVPDWVANSGKAQFFHLALSRDFDDNALQESDNAMLRAIGDQVTRFLTEARRIAETIPRGDLFAGCLKLAEARLLEPRLLWGQ